MADIPVVATQQRLAQAVGHFERDFGVHKRVTVAVAARPEAQTEHIRVRPVVNAHSQAIDEFFKNGRNGIIIYIFEEPAQAHRLVEGRGFFMVNESRFPELQQQLVYLCKVVCLDRIFQIVDNAQHFAGIKLGRVGG
ncbi:hypothetical protein D3C87_1698820 [compost metagenome]